MKERYSYIKLTHTFLRKPFLSFLEIPFERNHYTLRMKYRSKTFPSLCPLNCNWSDLFRIVCWICWRKRIQCLQTLLVFHFWNLNRRCLALRRLNFYSIGSRVYPKTAAFRNLWIRLRHADKNQISMLRMDFCLKCSTIYIPLCSSAESFNKKCSLSTCVFPLCISCAQSLLMIKNNLGVTYTVWPHVVSLYVFKCCLKCWA